jgi:hypothetical protein
MRGMSQAPRIAMPAKRPYPETETVMASSRPNDSGALEPTACRADHVETADIEGGLPPEEMKAETDHATEEMAPRQAGGSAPETDPAGDDTSFAPSDAPAARSAVMARPGPDGGLSFVPQPEAESPFASEPPAPRASGRPSTRRRPAEAVAARPSASARMSPSSRRIAVSGRRAIGWIIAVVLIACLAVAGIIMFAGQESPERMHATGALAEASRQLALSRGAVANRQGAQARAAYLAAIHELEGSSLLVEPAKAPPGSKLVPELTNRAASLRAEAEVLLSAIRRVEAGLRARIARLGDASTDVDRLERDLAAFCLNPVDPAGAADAANAETYARLIGEVKLRQGDIVRERERRHAERVTIPVNQARLKAEGLVKEERYGEALAMIDQARTTHPDADFVPVMQMVNDSALKGWQSAKAFIDTRIADAKAAGTTANQRQASLASARNRLNQVISRFGVEPYVGQAKAMLAALP